MIDLHVERLRGQAPGLPVLVALAGGPGQSATSVAWHDALKGALGAVQLVVFDQRGTGVDQRGTRLSGALKCKKLEKKRDKLRCNRRLGPAGAFYRTADSVRDLDAVRAALGVERLILFGISYGTFVAAEYARTFPERVERLVLDSPVGPNGDEALAVTTAHAAERVLDALCRDGACAGVTSDPVGDTAALVRRLADRPLRGKVRVAGKKPKTIELAGSDLLRTLVEGDLSTKLRALYPAAVAAARAGDAAPLVRLAWLAKASQGSAMAPVGAAGDERDPNETLSDTLFLATSCADTRFPWDADARPRRRHAALQSAAQALPETAPFPFDRATLLGFDVADDCLEWPRTTLPGATVLGPLPDVPVLVLVGEADLRTPVENAAALTHGLPRAATVVVPHQGHSVISDQECARATLARFLTGAPLEELCDVVTSDVPVQPVPGSLDGVPEARGLTGVAGRTVTAVERTLIDAVLATNVVRGDVGGLRRGTIECPDECPETNRRLRLTRASLVRGVAVSGTIMLTDENWTASVTVNGRNAAVGSLEFNGRSVTGRLGDQDVATTSGLGRELGQLAARRAIPSIVARPRHQGR